MNAFGIAAGAAALAGGTIGTIATIKSTRSEDVGATQQGLVREEVRLAGGLALPAAMGAAFLGMTTDTPGLYLAASGLLGLTAGTMLGSMFV